MIRNNKIFKPQSNKMINISILIFFFLLVIIKYRVQVADTKEFIQQQAIISAGSLNNKLLIGLRELSTDNDNYIFLKQQLINLKRSIQNCKNIYLLKKNNNDKLIFLISSDSGDHKNSIYKTSGKIYEIIRNHYSYFDNKTKIVSNSYRTEKGTFICAIIPIILSNGEIILFVMEIDANDWFFLIIKNILPFIFLIMLTIIAFIVMESKVKSTLTKAEQNKIESLKLQRLFNETTKSSEDGIIVTDAKGKIQSLNISGEEIIERTFEEIKGFSLDSVFILQSVKTGQNFENLFDVLLNSSQEITRIDDFILISKNKYAHISATVSKVYFQKIIQGIVIIFRDISEQKYFNQILEENQYKLKMIVEKSPIFIITTDTSGIISFFEGNLLKKLHMEKRVYIGTDIKNIFEEDLLFREKFLKTTIGLETSHVLKYKEMFIKTTIIPVLNVESEIDGVLIVGFDISENQRHHQSLKESEETFRALTENSYDTIMRFNKYLEHIYVNKQVERITGIPKYKFLGKKHSEIGFPGYLCEIWEKAIQEVFDTGKVKRIEFPLPNGIWIDWLLMPEFDNYKKVKAVITSARDISDKKKSETHLKFLQQYLSNIINSMPSGLMGINENGKIDLWNREISELLGKTVNDAINREATEYINIFGIEMDTIKSCMERQEKIELLKKELIISKMPQYFNIILYPLTAKDKKGVIVRVDNITKQIQLEKELVQSEKMVSLGGLALGMAHEINNPLAGVVHNIEVMKNRLLKPLPKNLQVAQKLNINLSTLSEYLRERKIDKLLDLIYSAGIRAADITINTLNFSQKGNVLKGDYQLSYLVNIALERLKDDTNYCEIYNLDTLIMQKDQLDFSDKIHCNKEQIIKVIICIIKNALEAILESDKKAKIEINIFNKINTVQLNIIDNGIGIEKGMINHVFDPFYTTKSPNKHGAGLGLALSYFIIVHNHGGELQLDENYKEGTKFIVNLPAIA